jgi:hypothetical protein
MVVITPLLAGRLNTYAAFIDPTNATAPRREGDESRTGAIPPPWTAEETDACFIVRDVNRQALAYVYFRG